MRNAMPSIFNTTWDGKNIIHEGIGTFPWALCEKYWFTYLTHISIILSLLPVLLGQVTRTTYLIIIITSIVKFGSNYVTVLDGSINFYKLYIY